MNLIGHFLNPMLMFLMPLALGAVLARRLKVSWGLYFVGAGAFIGSQILHIPFNAWVLGPVLRSIEASLPAEALPLVTALALGLSAGLFEEPARYLAIRSQQPRRQSWRNALMIGAGHGGVESILVGLLAFSAFLQATALRGADLAALGLLEGRPLLEAQLAEYWSAPWYLSMLGALERASALVIQIALTTLVFQAFARRNRAWLGLSIGAHTLVNAAALLALGRWGPYWAEALIAALALGGLMLILKFKAPDPPRPRAPEDAERFAPGVVPRDFDADQLEDSRYV